MSHVAFTGRHVTGRAVGRTIVMAAGILTLVALTSVGVGAAARGGVLIPVALPFAVVLAGVLRLIGPSGERAAWAVFTLWLGTTYLQTGAGSELVVAVAYLGLAVTGALVTPWAYVVAWAFHPIWDFLPRTLPPLLTDLPMACLLFDGVIAIYLAWAARTRRWSRSPS